MRALIVSDVHLEDLDSPRERHFLDFLREIRPHLDLVARLQPGVGFRNEPVEQKDFQSNGPDELRRAAFARTIFIRASSGAL